MSILLFYANSAFALNWDDNKWIESGCPSTLMGTWSSDSNNFLKKTLDVTKGAVIFSYASGRTEKFLFIDNTLQSEKGFIEIAPESTKKKDFKYLKIRPHLVNFKSNPVNANEASSICFIKVFAFFSKERAKFDKYLNWDVYRLEKSK